MGSEVVTRGKNRRDVWLSCGELVYARSGPSDLKNETRWNKVEQDKLIQQIRVSKNREEVEDGWRERDNGEVQNIPRLWAWHFFYQLDNLIISAYRYLPKV